MLTNSADGFNVTTIGTFGISTGAIVAGDPCYAPEDGGVVKIFAKNGTWQAVAVLDRDGTVREIAAQNSSHASSFGFQTKAGEISVDSGQAGFFDAEIFPKCHEELYDEICNATNEGNGGTIEGGVASSSGYGDGTYDLFASLDENGLAVALRIVFVSDEEEEPEDEPEDDDDDEMREDD
jgi:hypothetical protein